MQQSLLEVGSGEEAFELKTSAYSPLGGGGGAGREGRRATCPGKLSCVPLGFRDGQFVQGVLPGPRGPVRALH